MCGQGGGDSQFSQNVHGDIFKVVCLYEGCCSKVCVYSPACLTFSYHQLCNMPMTELNNLKSNIGLYSMVMVELSKW